MQPSNRQHGFHDVNWNLESQGIQPIAKTRCLLSRRIIKTSAPPPTSLTKDVKVTRFPPFYWYKVRKRGFTVPFCFVRYWSCIQASFVSLVFHCLSLLHVVSLCVFQAIWRTVPSYCPLTQPSYCLLRVIDSSPVRRTTPIFREITPLRSNQIRIVSSAQTNFSMINSLIHQWRQHNLLGRHAQTVTSDRRDIASSKQAESTTSHEG